MAQPTNNEAFQNALQALEKLNSHLLSSRSETERQLQQGILQGRAKLENDVLANIRDLVDRLSITNEDQTLTNLITTPLSSATITEPTPSISSTSTSTPTPTDSNNDHLILSPSPTHPANLIPRLCAHFYTLGWVTGTGGGVSILSPPHIFIAPSGVQKELIQPTDIFVMEYPSRTYLRKPPSLKPSACTPLFLAAFDQGAKCCIHTHSQWAVLVTLLVERDAKEKKILSSSSSSSSAVNEDPCFEITQIEQLKGLPLSPKSHPGKNLGYFDTLRVPIIANTAHEEDLTESLQDAMEKYPDTCAVLVRRHGVYVWGEDVAGAKTRCESLDYLFRVAVEMRGLGLGWMGGD